MIAITNLGLAPGTPQFQAVKNHGASRSLKSTSAIKWIVKLPSSCADEGSTVPTLQFYKTYILDIFGSVRYKRRSVLT